MIFPWRYIQFILGTHWDNYLTGCQKYRKCTMQYFVLRPLAFITASTLLGILSINFRHTSGSIAFHTSATLSNLPNSCCWCFILAQLQFDMMPEVFNGIKVWRLWCPV